MNLNVTQLCSISSQSLNRCGARCVWSRCGELQLTTRDSSIRLRVLAELFWKTVKLTDVYYGGDVPKVLPNLPVLLDSTLSRTQSTALAQRFFLCYVALATRGTEVGLRGAPRKRYIAFEFVSCAGPIPGCLFNLHFPKIKI